MNSPRTLNEFTATNITALRLTINTGAALISGIFPVRGVY